MSKFLSVDSIRIDGGTQCRSQVCDTTVAEYCDLWNAKVDFPPLVVFHDGNDYWLADGFHRYLGGQRAGRASFPVEIIKGTKDDAVLYAVGANKSHGLKRTTADKRKAVGIMLNHPEWVKWSDRRIAEHAGVSDMMVGAARKQLQESCSSSPAAKAADAPRVGKDGKQRKPPAPKAPKAPKAETQAEPAKQKAKAPKKDGWGIPIQEHAAPAFEAVPLFDELLSMLRKVKVLYADLAEKPGGAFLQRPGVSRNVNGRFRHDGLENLIAALEDSKPTYTVCPYEYHGAAIPESKHRHDKKCHLCHGLNWSRELGKQERSEKVIEFIKEKFGV